VEWGVRVKASKSCVNEITVSGEALVVASGDVTVYTEAHSAIVIVILIIIINRVNGRACGRAGGSGNKFNLPHLTTTSEWGGVWEASGRREREGRKKRERERERVSERETDEYIYVYIFYIYIYYI